jgi:hypothetical protein
MRQFAVLVHLSFCFSSFSIYSLKVSDRDRLSPYSLNRYAYSKYSQFGEEGMIEEIFKRLNISKGFFVEFGGADGILLSNTRLLWEKGWHGVMIEKNPNLFNKMLENYKNLSSILCINEFVTWHEGDKRGLTFDKIADRYFPNQEIDFLSIDIDGCDYFIFKLLTTKPKVICIENNINWHPLFDQEVPVHIAAKNLHQPLSCLIRLARQKGYEPIGATINVFLIRRDLYESFKEFPSDTLTLWRDAFRAMPKKDVLISRRKNNKFIRELEGEKFEEMLPIAEDF